MNIDNTIKDFMAGFIVAGGDDQVAEQYAMDFAACNLSARPLDGLKDPVFFAQVRALALMFPGSGDLEAMDGSLAAKAVRRWLRSAGFMEPKGDGFALTEKGYQVYVEDRWVYSQLQGGQACAE